ncbi:hypothetical protein L1887_11823 [Cichorium endivia]|nr:hypothetical protein L1887_11823 [Cichorium endivia]
MRARCPAISLISRVALSAICSAAAYLASATMAHCSRAVILSSKECTRVVVSTCSSYKVNMVSKRDTRGIMMDRARSAAVLGTGA